MATDEPIAADSVTMDLHRVMAATMVAATTAAMATVGPILGTQTAVTIITIVTTTVNNREDWAKLTALKRRSSTMVNITLKQKRYLSLNSLSTTKLARGKIVLSSFKKKGKC